MKEYLTQGLFYFLVFFSISNHLSAQSSPGTMPDDTLFICDYTGLLRIQNNGDEQLQAGDVLNYIITNTSFVSMDIPVISTDGVFMWDSLLQKLNFSENTCDEFFIRAIAGKGDGTGRVEDISSAASTAPMSFVVFGIGLVMDPIPPPVFLPIKAGFDTLIINASCEGRRIRNTTEKIAACTYECPCVDTLYVTSIDTLFPTWYVLENDSSSLRVQGDTIFRSLSNYSHIDTIIIRSIEEEDAMISVQNINNAIPMTSFQLAFQAFDIRYDFKAGEAIIDTIYMPVCGSGEGIDCPPISVGLGYCEDRTTELDNLEYDSFCLGDTVLLKTRPMQGVDYLWNTGETTANIQIVEQDFYSVSMSDRCGTILIQSAIVEAEAQARFFCTKKSCNPTQNNYKISMLLEEANLINYSGGFVVEHSPDSISIMNIPISDTLHFKLKHLFSSCELAYQIVPPSCSPPRGSSVELCVSEDKRALRAVVNDTDEMTVNWYASPYGDDLLASDTLYFLPENPGTYYAETSYRRSGFIVETRTPLNWSIVDIPSIRVVEMIETHCNTSEGVVELAADGAHPPYSFFWENGATTARAKLLGVGDYQVSIVDAKACVYEYTATVKNNIDACDEIYFPTVFFPNSDNSPNRIFRPHVPDDFDKAIQLEIFDRFGKSLFESREINNGWDGTFSGQPLGGDVYMYVLKVTRPSGRVVKYKGAITLSRL